MEKFTYMNLKIFFKRSYFSQCKRREYVLLSFCLFFNEYYRNPFPLTVMCSCPTRNYGFLLKIKIIQATAVALGCLLEVERKSPLLKTVCPEKKGRIKLDRILNFLFEDYRS